MLILGLLLWLWLLLPFLSCVAVVVPFVGRELEEEGVEACPDLRADRRMGFWYGGGGCS